MSKTEERIATAAAGAALAGYREELETRLASAGVKRDKYVGLIKELQAEVAALDAGKVPEHIARRLKRAGINTVIAVPTAKLKAEGK